MEQLVPLLRKLLFPCNQAFLPLKHWSMGSAIGGVMGGAIATPISTQLGALHKPQG